MYEFWQESIEICAPGQFLRLPERDLIMSSFYCISNVRLTRLQLNVVVVIV